MKIIVTENYDEMSKVGAELLAEVVKNKPNAVLGLATGTTPLGTYARLADACHKGELSFKGVKTVNLDEYVGLGEESDQSYVWFMNHNLFDKIDIDKTTRIFPTERQRILTKSAKDTQISLKNCAKTFNFWDSEATDILHSMSREHRLTATPISSI